MHAQFPRAVLSVLFSSLPFCLVWSSFPVLSFFSVRFVRIQDEHSGCQENGACAHRQMILCGNSSDSTIILVGCVSALYESV